MATLTKVYDFVQQLGLGTFNLNTNTFKIALSSVAPNTASTNWEVNYYAGPTVANGYYAGGNAVTTTSYTNASGTSKLAATADLVFTAAGGTIGPFRYAILYNTTAANRMVGWYDYGSAITLNDTETFTVDFDQANGILTVA